MRSVQRRDNQSCITFPKLYIDTEGHKWVDIQRMPWKCSAAAGCMSGVSFMFEIDTWKSKAVGQQEINRSERKGKDEKIVQQMDLKSKLR